jgi:cytochrome c5
MHTRPDLTLLAPLLLILLGGCGPDGGTTTQPPEMPVFADETLSAGRSVWMGTCRNCHLLGVAGAPAVTDPAAWDQRLPKGRNALYASALGGIRDAHGAYLMPPQGGNPRLAESEVRLAVDYMVAAVEYLRASTP